MQLFGCLRPYPSYDNIASSQKPSICTPSILVPLKGFPQKRALQSTTYPWLLLSSAVSDGSLAGNLGTVCNTADTTFVRSWSALWTELGSLGQWPKSTCSAATWQQGNGCKVELPLDPQATLQVRLAGTKWNGGEALGLFLKLSSAKKRSQKARCGSRELMSWKVSIPKTSCG